MMEGKLISFDIIADFGFLKKPDINEGIYLTYNCLHKPALLGILGAIVGLGGYYQSFKKKQLPEYFNKLENVKVGIQPLNSFNGNFTKTMVKYNNSVGYASEEQGGNLIVNEQTLIKPSYRIYLLLDLSNEYENKLYDNLTKKESEYIPYLGKNDFQLWWDNSEEYKYNIFSNDSDYYIENLFLKEHIIKQIRETANRPRIRADLKPIPFYIFFERLPIGFNSVTSNYEYAEFAYTNFLFPKDVKFENLFHLENATKKIIIQLN